MTPTLRELLRLPIGFEAADGSTVHAPLMRGAVGGVETLLVVDTGSEVHLLTRELADRIGLALVEGEEGTDHSGTTMPSWAAGEVPMRTGGAEIALHDVVVIPAPAPFPPRGIGGILSPQLLRTDARVVIDLVDDELLLVDAELEAVAGWLAARHPAMTVLSLTRDGRTPTPVVPAAVAPFDAVATMLNTGGRHTEFDTTAVPDLALGVAERLGGGVSGADVMGSSAGPQVLLVGGAEIPVGRLAIRERVPYPHGLIGMDVLRGTVLCCDADPAGRVLWQV